MKIFTVEFDLKAAKEGFFDRKVVLDKLDKASHRALAKFGAFVMTRAKSSLRYSKKSSAPGQPPKVHRFASVRKFSKKLGRHKTRPSSPLRDFIFFAYDPERQSVVIGPVALPGAVGPRALETIEYGGSEPANDRVITVTNAVGRDAKGRFLSGGKGRVTLTGTLHYKARPFMGPALVAERANLAPLWQDSIR